MISKGNCEICGQQITQVETAAVPITGWAVERTAGGANQIVDKQVVAGRIAHAVCVRLKSRRKKSGHIEGQLTF